MGVGLLADGCGGNCRKVENGHGPIIGWGCGAREQPGCNGMPRMGNSPFRHGCLAGRGCYKGPGSRGLFATFYQTTPIPPCVLKRKRFPAKPEGFAVENAAKLNGRGEAV